MVKHLYLMRHGETLFNVRRKIQGWCDSPLTENGVKQAKAVREILKDIQFDHYYSSTAERCCDTLEIVTDHKVEYKRLKQLKERNFGIFEGESEDLNPPLPYGDFFVNYGGEGELQMRQRIADTLLEIMQKEDHKVVLAVSHGGACRGFMRYWQETSQVDQKGGLKNCCILKFEFEDNEFRLLEIINHNFDETKG